MTKKKQTRTFHVWRQEHDVDLSEWADEVTLLAENEDWLSFAPKKPNTFDAVPISRATDGDVWDQWFIESEGIVGRWYSRGFVVGVFALPTRDEPRAGTVKDLAEVLDLNDIGTSADWKAMKKLAKDEKALKAWTLGHRLEKVLGLPALEAPAKAPAKKRTASKPKKKARATPRALR